MQTIRQTLRLYLSAERRYWRSLVLTIGLTIVFVISADIIAPYLVSHILETLGNVVAGRASIDQAKQTFVLFVVASLVALVAGRINGFVANRRKPKVARDLERIVFAHLTQHSYAFFANRFGGALVAQANRFVRGYETLEDTFNWELSWMVFRIVGSVTFLIVAIPIIGIALLIWIIFFVASVLWLTYKVLPYAQRASGTETTLTARLADVIANMLNVKTFARRDTEIDGFRRLTKHRWLTRRRATTVEEYVWSYEHVMTVLFMILVLWLSISVIQSGSASIANVLLAQFFIARISGDISELPGTSKRISEALSDAAEMTQILQLPPEIRDPARPKPLTVAQGEIRFDRVTFAYPGHAPVFRNFSLTIPSGQRVGLVGQSGSGKSTLVKLLLRFVDIQTGAITIDWQDIKKVRQNDVRQNIAYVSQEPILFHRSLAENIRYARPEATDEEIREVAGLAHAAEFIEALPEQYDTLVGERGIKLSGGERQRVAIARAMLSNAPILVLDEATSSLDSRSEKLITDALKRLMQDRTTLVIAHRLSTIRNLDRILVMQSGRIAESGTHQELLKRGGVYSELWAHQSGGFLGE